MGNCCSRRNCYSMQSCCNAGYGSLYCGLGLNIGCSSECEYQFAHGNGCGHYFG